MRFVLCFLLFNFGLIVYSQEDTTLTLPSRWKVNFNSNLGLNFNSLSNNDGDNLNAQWQLNSSGKLTYEGEYIQLNSSAMLIYGQLHNNNSLPIKTQDNLLVTVTPSISILSNSSLRLFLETTGETQIAEGVLNDQKSNFMDPLFLYQTLFIGTKKTFRNDSGTFQLDFTLGAGYAIQQTITNKFVLQNNVELIKVNPDNPLSKFEIENGYSIVFDSNIQAQLVNDLNLTIGLKAIALSKTDFFNNYEHARASTLGTFGLHYGIIGIDYVSRMVYDYNYSKRRQLNQSLVFGLNLSL
ncbi:MAG: hypothetical protein NTW25_04775 [Candidatus Kapabacteria bacterium]|nr:hypothetical protein [Candidatus Kapabacteria bacterium]